MLVNILLDSFKMRIWHIYGLSLVNRLNAMITRARCTQYSEVNFWAERNFAHRMAFEVISPKGQNFCIDKKRPTWRAFTGLRDDIRVGTVHGSKRRFKTITKQGKMNLVGRSRTKGYWALSLAFLSFCLPLTKRGGSARVVSYLFY